MNLERDSYEISDRYNLYNLIPQPVAEGDGAIRLHPSVGIRARKIVRLDVNRVAEECVGGPDAVVDVPVNILYQNMKY